MNPQLPATCPECGRNKLDSYEGKAGNLDTGTGSHISVCPDPFHGIRVVNEPYPPLKHIHVYDARLGGDKCTMCGRERKARVCPTCGSESPWYMAYKGKKPELCPDEFHKAAEAPSNYDLVQQTHAKMKQNYDEQLNKDLIAEFTPPAEARSPQTPGSCLKCGAMNHMTADHTPPEATLAEHKHGENCKTVMAIRNTDINTGVEILDKYVKSESQRAVEAFAEGLKEQRFLVPLECDHSADDCQCDRRYAVDIKVIEAALKENK